MSLQQEIRRANQNVFEIESKLKQLVTDNTDITFNLIDPISGETISITHESLPKIKQKFEDWKQNFQGNLKNSANTIKVINVDAANGDDLADGIASPVRTFLRAKELIETISKHFKIKVQLAPGTYEDGGLLFSHLTNYVDIVGTGTDLNQVVINESGLIESFGASRFSLRNLKIISLSATNAILIRDTSSAYLENCRIEALTSTEAVKVENGAFLRATTLAVKGGTIGIMVARAFARIDTFSISNSQTGLYASVGGNVYRTNATYTNVNTNELADSNSIIVP